MALVLADVNGLAASIAYNVHSTSIANGTIETHFTVAFPFAEPTDVIGYSDEDFVALADTFAGTVATYIDGLADTTGTPVLTRHYPFIGETEPETVTY